VLARIIVLNWNGKVWLDTCLSALLPQVPGDCEVVLVDNGSSDGSVTFVREQFPSVRILSFAENLGFAGGNNAGAKGATARYLVFLNNDTRVRPGWLAGLTRAASEDASVGLVASQVVYLGRPATIDSAGDGYLRCGGGFKHWHGQPAATSPGSRDVFGACGAAFLIRRDLFEALGGFDEDFFMVYEDVDLSFRARLSGARCRYVADAVVEHAGSGSLGHVSAKAIFYGQRNLEWTWIKNVPGRLVWRSCLAHAAYDLAAAAGYARRGRLGTWVRAKGAALMGLPGALAKRRRIQRAAVVDPEALWALMEPDWVGVKRREKAFDFAESVTFGRSRHSPDS
jgi:GT2 family glycosyltransferase